ncbi:hypothetical protein ACFO8O_00005, partial [Hephaestia sp. GCM10023244]|uniref:hypothetical protein n=1 Tax=unclassified Hephaestia TaxID=2631281 RepID=UPI002076D74E
HTTTRMTTLIRYDFLIQRAAPLPATSIAAIPSAARRPTEHAYVERQRLREQAANRKRKQRDSETKRALRNREIPPILDEQLIREATHRRIRYRQYRNSGEAPRQITLDPNGENDRFTVDVWLAREKLTIQERSTTAYSIAGAMIEAERSYGLEQEVLRQRILSALKRISLLEEARLPGTSQRVWPPFNARRALDELLESTPYENDDP